MGFETVSFEEAPQEIAKSGIIAPAAHPCPDGYVIDAARQMDIDRWYDLHADTKAVLAMLAASPNSMCTVLSSFEGKLRHLKKYDRSDPPPDPEVVEFFTRILATFPRGSPDTEYLEEIRVHGHVPAFRERWKHVLHKSSGVDGEKLCGKPVSKGVFLDDPGAEALLSTSMESAMNGTFVPEMMRAAGRAKVMSQSAFEEIIGDWAARNSELLVDPSGSSSESDSSEPQTPSVGGVSVGGTWFPVEPVELSDDLASSRQSRMKRAEGPASKPVKTMDRLIWISPATSLHAATPGAKTMSRGVKEAEISTYGLSPFKGGAQALYSSFGYLGPHVPTTMQTVLSNVPRREKDLYASAMLRDRDHHMQNLFGMGSDVSRMDSSMREWFISLWGGRAYQDFPLDEGVKANMARALVAAHCGGKLAMEGGLVATVEEGASTGAVGVSTLESTYRWISDLLGVTFNLQKEIVIQLRRATLRGCKVDSGTVGLAGRNYGLGWLKSSRVGFNVVNRRSQLSREEEVRRVRLQALYSKQDRPEYAMYPPLGPGTPLFEELLPIVAYYYNTRANGDDDWNTFPLLEYAELSELPQILDSGARSRWLRSPPKNRVTVRKIISNERMENAANMLNLPTRLNAEKGVEGRGLRTFMLNSMRPVWSEHDQSFSFYIDSSSLENGLLGVTHPDDIVTDPAHSVLRLVGLCYNHPDPRAYEAHRALAMELAVRHDLLMSGGYLDVSQHIQREKNNTLYNLMGPGTHDLDAATELREGRVRFPEYHEVLSHHGFGKSAEFVREVGSGWTVQGMLDEGFPRERWGGQD
jgi:hypothetical protein